MKNTFTRLLNALPLGAALLFYGCDKEEPVNPNEITKPYYFQVVLDGDTTTYQEDVDDYGNIVGDFFGGEVSNGWEYAPFTCIASAEAVANPNPTTLAASGAVSIVAMPSGQISDLATYTSLVETGPLGYGFLSRDPGTAATPGAFVSVYDASGVEWNTNNGPQDSTASFLVTEYYSSVDNERLPPTRQLFAATFNCKVYNSSGASKTLTGGKVRGRMIIFN